MRRARDRPRSRWASAAGRRPSTSSTSTQLLREPAERDRLAGELREHGLELSCVNAAGNPLHPHPPSASTTPRCVRGAIELAAPLGVEPRRHDERVSGRSRRRRDARVRAVGAHARRRAALGVAVRASPGARSGTSSRRGRPRRRPGSGSASSCTPAPRRTSSGSFLRVRRARRAQRAASTSTRATSGGRAIDPLCVIEEVGDRIGFAHGKDTLLHADRISREGVIDFRHPVDPDVATWHFAAVGHRPHGRAMGRAAVGAARRRLRRRRLDRARGPAHERRGGDRDLARGAPGGAQAGGGAVG